MHFVRYFAAGALVLAGGLAAQSGARIIGLTASTPFLQSQDLVTCNARRCTPQGAFGQTVFDVRGGTAYDTRTRGTWISNGTLVAKVDSRNACAYQCAPFLLPPVAIDTLITGLAFDHRANRLWVTDSSNLVRVYDINGCTVTFAFSCSVLLPLGNTLTGIAIDDVDGRVFMTASNFSGPAAGGLVLVSRQQDPCEILCSFPVQACNQGPSILGPLTGIAFNACEGEIWVTDGRTSVAGIVSANCVFAQTGCCVNPSLNDPYMGLCIEPSTEDSTGVSCTNGSCDPTCNPTHFLGNGDPVIGNIGFTMDASNLPANEIAATFFNAGVCDPIGYTVPLFCGPLHVPLTPGLLSFPQPTGGGAGCSGSTSLNFSIQPNPATCGLTISTQVLGICSSTGGIGTFSTNCLTWTVTSS